MKQDRVVIGGIDCFLEEDDAMRRLALLGPVVNRELISYVREHDIRSICFRYGLAERPDFLLELPHLESFSIIQYDANIDLGPVAELSNLRKLYLQTYSRIGIDYARLTRLEELHCDWTEQDEPALGMSWLKVLGVMNFPHVSLTALRELAQLHTLEIWGGGLRTLDGLECLQSIRVLDLAHLKQLRDIDALAGAPTLISLSIESCRRIAALDPCGELTKLQSMAIDNCGDIISLKPLARLRHLRVVSFIESTNVLDGNLAVLCDLSGLEYVMFRNRRHYSHRREDFPQRRVAEVNE